MHSVVYGQTEPPAVNVKNAGAIGGAFVSLLATIGMVLIYVLVCFMLYKKRQLDTGRSQASSTPVGRFMHHCTPLYSYTHKAQWPNGLSSQTLLV